MAEREDSLKIFHRYKGNNGRIIRDSDEYGEEQNIMKLENAKIIAEEIIKRLAPFCYRIEVAGSIRRECPTVGDIEIVCIPEMVEYQDTFFDAKMEKHPGFVKAVDSWEKVKGDAKEGKYMQRLLPENIKLDIFTASEYNWGLIFAIRTGSAQFSHKVLAMGWKKKGYTSISGILTSNSGDIPVYEEKDLFKIIGIPWIPPKAREL